MRDHALGAQQEGALDRKQPDRAAAPDRDRVAGLDVAHLRAHVAGRQDVGEEQHLLVGEAVLDLERPDIGKRHARELGLPAGEAAGEVRIAERPRCRMPQCLLGQGGVRIRVLAERPVVVPALPAVAAGNRERHDDAVADLEVLDRAPDLHHLAHELVAEDVALLHWLDEAVVEVQVRAADRGGGDADDRVALIQDLADQGRRGPRRCCLPIQQVAFIDRTSASGAWAARCFERALPGTLEAAIRAHDFAGFHHLLEPAQIVAELLAGSSPNSFATQRTRLAGRRVVVQIDAGPRCRDRRAPVVKRTEPSCWMSLPGSDRQAMSSPGRSSTISASHSTC